MGWREGVGGYKAAITLSTVKIFDIFFFRKAAGELIEDKGMMAWMD